MYEIKQSKNYSYDAPTFSIKMSFNEGSSKSNFEINPLLTIAL